MLRYLQADLSDDIALIKLSTPLLFNRWVKPICLPTPGRVKSETSANNWVNGPDPGTICTAVKTNISSFQYKITILCE